MSVYPELGALVRARLLDYRGYFLRGVGGNRVALDVEQQDPLQSITVEYGQHFKKLRRLEIIHGVLTTFQQLVEGAMCTG